MRRFEIMKWKMWIAAVVAFAGICLLTDWVFTSRVVLGSPLSDSARIRHLYLDNSDDIPIFGTSKAHFHYCPDDMGLRAYDYGIDGASYEVTDVLLQIELAKSRTTPVIIELQHSDTESVGFVGKYIPYVYDPRFRQLLNRFHQISWRFYVPGIRYFGYFDSFLRDTYLPVFKVSHGFAERLHPKPFDQAEFDKIVRKDLGIRTGYFPNEDRNRRLIAHITGHPQRLFFLVVSPYHSSYFSHFENSDEFVAFEEKLAAIPNVVLIDWGRLYDSDMPFCDTLHLQREAAADFSRQLGEKIRQTLRERSQPASVARNGSK